MKWMFLLCILLLMPVMCTADEQCSLVTPAWVAAHANDPDIRILDVRWDPHEYFAGHVPNAVHMADNSLRGPLNGVPVQYLPPEQMAQVLALAGVIPKHKVIIYSDGAHVLGATMTAYVLDKLGHKSVMLIDGGWNEYKTTQQASKYYPRYTTVPKYSVEVRPIYVTLDEVKKAIGKPDITIIDARPNKAYTGEVNIWMRNGHIPGAINIDWHQLVDADNPHKFKSVKEMQAIFDAKGIDKSDDIILYCGTSREASLEFVAMKHLLGYPNVRLYEGSWTEYCADPECKVETGNPK